MKRNQRNAKGRGNKLANQAWLRDVAHDDFGRRPVGDQVQALLEKCEKLGITEPEEFLNAESFEEFERQERGEAPVWSQAKRKSNLNDKKKRKSKRKAQKKARRGNA